MNGFIITFLFLVSSGAASAAGLSAKIYEYGNPSGGRHLYIYVGNEKHAQIFSCGRKDGGGLLLNQDLDTLLKEQCAPIFEPGRIRADRMMSGIRKGNSVSLHIGGTDEVSESEGMFVLNPSASKSWTGIFHLDLAKDQAMLFTGVGIQIDDGLPRTDSTRITLEKVSEGELRQDHPLLPLRVQ
jgi:hypothetical protein